MSERYWYPSCLAEIRTTDSIPDTSKKAKQFGTSIDELIEQLQATEEREVMDPPEGCKVDEICFFEQRTLKPKEVRERARYHLECIAKGPNSLYSVKERKRFAKLIGYTGKIEVDHYVRNEIIKARLKEAAEILLYASIAAGVIAGGGYIGKLAAHYSAESKK